MKEEALFSASADIARRAGVVNSSYRTADGRFILSESDLSPVRLVMTPDEYVNGIDVVKITKDEATRLISENGYSIGEYYLEQPQAEQPSAETEGQETTEE